MESDTKALIQNGTPEDEDNKEYARVRWITVEPVILMYFIYFSPGLLLAEQYIFKVISAKYNYSDHGNLSMCASDNESVYNLHLQQKVQSESSHILLVLGASGRLISIFSTLFLGAFSDYGGRKISMIVPLVGTVLKCLVFALVIWLKLNYWFLAIGTTIEGLTGYIGALLTGCFAYIADVSPTKSRTIRVTILEVCIGVASALSQFASGFLIDAIGYLFTFLALLIITVLNILYIIFLVKETRTRENSDGKYHLFSFNRVIECTRLYTKDDGTNRRWKLQLAILTMTVVGMVSISSTDVRTYFLKGKPLCFSEIQIGLFSGILNLSQNFGSIVVVMLLGRRLGDKGLMILGCLSGLASMLLMTFVQNTWMLALVLVLGLLGFLVIPMVRAISSKLVKQEEQGAMNAIIASAESVSNTIGTTANNALYSATLHIIPGFVFIIMAGVYIIGLILSSCLFYFTKKEERSCNNSVQKR